ncbi:MAG TPA: antibiotic biosynthesis monooxygenase [Chloroflexota bacterium]|nr:antibiotic biosynthesis monooxygenase [Chloroflexota bacterium]
MPEAETSVCWPEAMTPGAVAVIFVSQRTGADDEGYAAASDEMVRLASAMPGFISVDSVRSFDGLGITVSYWADEEAAVAWRNEANHAMIREAGRRHWYEWYRLSVTKNLRCYDWRRSS